MGFDAKRILTAFDRLLGWVPRRVLGPPPPSSQSPEVPRQALFIRPGGLGDALLLLPVLQAFMRHFPETRVDVLAERRNLKAFELIEGIRHVDSYDRPATFWRLRQRRYDLVVDTEQWYVLSTLYGRLLGAKRLIGFATNRRESLHTTSVPYRQDAYEMEAFADLVEVIGVPRPTQSGVFLPPPPGRMHTNDAQAQQGLTQQLVAVFPGGTHPAKCWPLEKYREVVEALLKSGCRVVVLGGASELSLAEELCNGLDAENLAGTTTLKDLVAVFGRAALLISGDSGLLHLAALCGCPTVALFGPSNRRKWAPQGACHVALSRDAACAPCSRFGRIPVCRYHWHCLHDIEPREVLEAVQHVLAQPCPRD